MSQATAINIKLFATITVMGLRSSNKFWRALNLQNITLNTTRYRKELVKSNNRIN